MKIIGALFGIALIVGGIYCLVTPVETFSVFSWLIGFAMLVEGVSSAFTWNQRRKFGFADGWTLVAAIVSIVLGIIVLGSYAARYAIDAFLAYMIAAWLVIGGVSRIIAAVGLQRLGRSGIMPGNMASSSWILMLLVGILVVAMGIVCFFHPMIAMASVGMILGLSIIVAGISILAAALTS